MVPPELQKLYETLQTLRHYELSTTEVERKVKKLETDWIDQEGIPHLQETADNFLEGLQDSVSFTLNYTPGQPLVVEATRNDKTKKFKEVPTVPLKVRQKRRVPGGAVNVNTHKEVRKDTRLRVTFPDEKVIEEKNASDTFIAVIQRLGPERVNGLNIMRRNRNLVHREGPLPNYKSVGGGYFLLVHSNTKEKQSLLKKIANALYEDVSVEIVQKEK